MRLVAVIERLQARASDQAEASSWTTDGAAAPDTGPEAGGRQSVGGLPAVNRQAALYWLVALTGRHRDALAVVYVRQSTHQQVLDHGESTRLQDALVDRAVALGWQAGRVLVIDDELGKSGTSAIARPGSNAWSARSPWGMSGWYWASRCLVWHALWRAESTTDADRKELIRAVLEKVTIAIVGESEQVTCTLTWAGGHTTTGPAIRAVRTLEQLSYYPRLIARIRELAQQGRRARPIARILAAEGFPAKGSDTIGVRAIEHLLEQLGFPPNRRRRAAAPPGEEPGPQEWRLDDFATELGMPPITLRPGQAKAGSRDDACPSHPTAGSSTPTRRARRSLRTPRRPTRLVHPPLLAKRPGRTTTRRLTPMCAVWLTHLHPPPEAHQ